MTALSLGADYIQRHALPPNLIHDLRTPLNQIIGYSEMLEEQAQEVGLEHLVPDLASVRGAGQQLLRLIDSHFYSTTGSTTDQRKADTFTAHDLPAGYLARAEKQSEGAVLGEPVSAVDQRRMLVVDDVEANRDVLTRRLKRQGFVVATAENGRQAMEMVRKTSFDLVLLDIMMPEMDGFEVLRRLKADENLKHIPVIMISALSELDSVVKCIEMGAEDYLHKPFNPTLLKARIGACLGKKLARDRESLIFEQLKESFKRLEELEKERDNLTHMIIHDLRTPLSSVIVGMQTLDLMGELNADQLEMKNIAVSGGQTLLGMINDLLDVEKFESGSMPIEYSELPVLELVESAVGQVKSLSDDKQLKVAIQISADVPRVRGDGSKLSRTLVNLLGNAIKFTPSGGIVTVEVMYRSDCGMAEFSVRDTGEGIPTEAFGRIFEKFGQVEERKAGRSMSTGLGLTFCKLAVEAHGGQIGVESEPRVGSRFWFTIPVE